jgi:alanyl-tRNA synthetase
VRRTGDIGICKIIYEGSISAGVRRIEAISGTGALARFQETIRTLHCAADAVHAPESDLVHQIERVVEEKRALERRLDQIKERLAYAHAAGLEMSARVVKGVKVLAAEVPGMDRAQMRALVDSFRNKWKTAIVVLASAEDSNVAIISGVTKDLTTKVHAGKLVGAVAQAVGGKGGGRPDMAEAGGKNPAGLPGALANVYTAVEGML